MAVPKLRFTEFTHAWEERKLGEILVEGRLGGNYENSESNDGHPVIKMGNLGRGTINLDKIQYLPEGKEYNKEDVLQDGDLLFNTRNTLELVGKVSIWRNELPFALYNSNLMRMKFDQSIDASNRFMNYLFNTKKSINQLRSFATGTTSVAAIYGRDLKRLRVKFPSIEEQYKIASFLSKVDEKIEKLENKQELWETYKKGIMQQIFSQKLRFKDENGENYPDWEEKKFGNIMEFGKAGGTPTSTQKKYYDGHIPFLSIADMTSQGKNIYSTEKYLTEEGLNNSSAWIVPKNSLLYSIYASVGSVAINKSDITTSQAIFGIILKENIATNYVYYYLLDYKKYIHRFIETGTQGNLNAKTVRNLVIKLPLLEEQEKISSFLSSLDIKIENLNKKLQIYNKFKKGLLQQMFC